MDSHVDTCLLALSVIMPFSILSWGQMKCPSVRQDYVSALCTILKRYTSKTHSLDNVTTRTNNYLLKTFSFIALMT